MLRWRSQSAFISSATPFPGRISAQTRNASTWWHFSVDSNDDGYKDVWDAADAIPLAANCLKASGAPADYRAAWGRSNLTGGAAPALTTAEQRRLRELFCGSVIEVVAAAFAHAARTGRPMDPPLFLMMDEVANVTPLPKLDEIASTDPGQGVLLCTILQNLS